MIAGLKHRFIPRVESGDKRHTIRRGKRWKVGMRIDLFKDVRQKTMKLIFRAPVTRVDDITIHVELTGLTIFIGEHELDASEKEALAIADGFNDRVEMFEFWSIEHGYGRFGGQIIHWDYDRRTYA